MADLSCWFDSLTSDSLQHDEKCPKDRTTYANGGRALIMHSFACYINYISNKMVCIKSDRYQLFDKNIA